MNVDYTAFLPQQAHRHLHYFDRKIVTAGGQQTPLLYYQHRPKKSAGKLVITAGFDGDEIDGILAALELAVWVDKQQPNVSVVIVPVVNVWGFVKGVSEIPGDGSFPKHYFPGSPRGNMAERLVWELGQLIDFRESVWLDLHGGSRFERMSHYVCGYHTGTSIDESTKSVLSQVATRGQVYFIDSYNWEKISRLADKHASYLLCEAGDLGKSSEEAIVFHRKVAKVVLHWMERDAWVKGVGMPLSTMERGIVPRGVEWMPQVEIGQRVKSGNVVGSYRWGWWRRQVRAKHDGVVCWIRQASKMNLSEAVFEINYPLSL